MPEPRSAEAEAARLLALLPHRYPMLLVDRLEAVEPGARASGYKHVSFNEPHFAGHFPGRPLMPGVLILEALAQLGAACMLSAPEHRGKLPLFTGVDACRFRRPVVPGDRLDLEITVLKFRQGFGKVDARASVGGALACEARLLFSLVENPAP